MNEMNELEIALRLWAPRRPSAKVEKRLFAQPAPQTAPEAPAEKDYPRFNFAWLAPAMAALLLMGVLLNQRSNTNISRSSGSNTLVAMILSNQNASAYLPGSFQHEQNNVPANTFKWTNVSGLTSSIGSLSHPRGSIRHE